jgi:hypothetical protein
MPTNKTTTAAKTSNKPKAPDLTPTIPIETTVSIFGSEKGGMGKSIVASIAAAQMTAANQPFYLIDADASTPNVGLTYRQEFYQQFQGRAEIKNSNLPQSLYNPSGTATLAPERIVFTGSESDYFLADQIFDMAKQKDVMLVLPSQVAKHLSRWLDQNDVVGMLADPNNKIKFVYYFITNGTPESLELFKESVEAFGGKIPHVLVKNLGAATNIRWSRFDEDGKVQALLDKYGFQSIFFPEILIAPEDKNKILSEYIPWGEAIESDWIPFSTKRRLTKCLKEATQALGSTGLIPYHPDYIPEAVMIAQAGAAAAVEIELRAAETDAAVVAEAEAVKGALLEAEANTEAQAVVEAQAQVNAEAEAAKIAKAVKAGARKAEKLAKVAEMGSASTAEAKAEVNVVEQSVGMSPTEAAEAAFNEQPPDF